MPTVLCTTCYGDDPDCDDCERGDMYCVECQLKGRGRCLAASVLDCSEMGGPREWAVCAPCAREIQAVWRVLAAREEI